MGPQVFPSCFLSQIALSSKITDDSVANNTSVPTTSLSTRWTLQYLHPPTTTGPSTGRVVPITPKIHNELVYMRDGEICDRFVVPESNTRCSSQILQVRRPLQCSSGIAIFQGHHVHPN